MSNATRTRTPSPPRLTHTHTHTPSPSCWRTSMTCEQQDASTKLGMWTFLATEVMFFGGMFLAYILFRNFYHGGFAEGSNSLIMMAGFINTGVLLVSSLTMALAVDDAKLGKYRTTVIFLLITMVLGSIVPGREGV